ncbi:hypothetical protein [Streptomyces sp. NBC_00525]|uniref:hypothetical protein n=1 Tax=Streptomyces sp. NBC_00525 TaxID=2903660 RepID=UPI002E808923|nr:hypothetical protein [Streptomyces sp. NBC_00525]WUC97877.1 hypothetical protein OG710_29805 [Streptomyces sp. NBC_00525]
MTVQHSVQLDPATGQKVDLLARAWNTTPGEAVRRLVEHFEDSPAPAAHSAPDVASPALVPVHVFYSGHRISGTYDRENRSLTIADGPAAGTYKTPSGAASAVLHALRPDVRPNRNGWSFWTVDETGEILQSIR